jgi:hypothetical protein
MHDSGLLRAIFIFMFENVMRNVSAFALSSYHVPSRFSDGWKVSFVNAASLFHSQKAKCRPFTCSITVVLLLNTVNRPLWQMELRGEMWPVVPLKHQPVQLTIHHFHSSSSRASQTNVHSFGLSMQRSTPRSPHCTANALCNMVKVFPHCMRTPNFNPLCQL